MAGLFNSFRMPAEWERHEATWLVWPKDPSTFPDDIIGDVEQIYVKMIKELAKGEKVNLLVDDERMEKKVGELLGDAKTVVFHKIRTADVWIRDYGPIFVKGDGRLATTKWIFNSWGNKYDELLADNGVGMEVAKRAGFDVFETKIILESGSIETNGEGVFLTTKQCLLNKNRNPTLKQNEIEKCLHDFLGAEKIIWLEEGIAGDDTDGHVDDIARFVSRDTVICMVEEDKNDENYEALKKNYELLKKTGLNVIPLQMPGKVEYKGDRLPASYANFYIGNSAVLVPIFGDAKDEKALSALRKFFPDRKVVGINCRSLIYGFGGLHCVTQQQPAL